MLKDKVVNCTVLYDKKEGEMVANFTMGSGIQAQTVLPGFMYIAKAAGSNLPMFDGDSALTDYYNWRSEMINKTEQINNSKGE